MCTQKNKNEKKSQMYFVSSVFDMLYLKIVTPQTSPIIDGTGTHVSRRV
jgi:hypothetical protein